MTEPLKSFFSPDLVRRLAADLLRVHAGFPAEQFIEQACTGLAGLELLDRGRHIARTLANCLPAYPHGISILLDSLGPGHASDELAGAGMAPFYYLPHTLYVAEYGLDHFELSLRAQLELTKRFSAEFSIRPFIAKDPERTFGFLHRCAGDSNAHVRRLASEGTRLRLPWAGRVQWLDANPGRVLALLEALKDDPVAMVRRSVANNLNDMGKVHPELLTRTCAAWLVDASTERGALVEHALRSAIKRAEPAALKLLGYGGKPSIAVENVRFEPPRVAIGDTVTCSFKLRSTSSRAQELLVDLAVHFVKAAGHSRPKVFKLRRVTLPPGGEVELNTRVSLRVHTTRRPNPGAHVVEVLINGVAERIGSFLVTAANRERKE